MVTANRQGPARSPTVLLKFRAASAKADTLTVKGKRVVEEAPEGAQYFRRERGEGAFSRSYALPFKIDQEQVQASYVNGVLTVTLPKAKEVQPRKISILNN